MRLFAAGTLLFGVGCVVPPPTQEASKPAVVSSPAPSPEVRGLKLNDVQLECRSRLMGTIGTTNQVLMKPGCGDGMNIALNNFDYGSGEGAITASLYQGTEIMSCICISNPYNQCNSVELETVKRGLETFPEVEAKRRRDAVFFVTNELLKNPCIDAALGVELFKLGYTCGYGVGIASPMLHHEMADAFTKSFPGRPDQAAELTDVCWKQSSAAAPPAARP